MLGIEDHPHRNMMTSKERIYKILNLKTPDRIGMHDIFLDSTIEGWRADGLPRDLTPEDYFGFDFEIFDIGDVLSNPHPAGTDNERFTCLTFAEPFQRICDIFGREDTLRRVAHCPEGLGTDLIRETDRILDSLQTALQKGIRFDAAWAWGDLAYNKGLFFSLFFYEKFLLPLHKEIFRFLNSQDIFILFHSEGMIYDLIPHLLDAGVKALHPLEEKSGMDIQRLLKDYRNDIVFMGCMDIGRLVREKDNFKKLKERIEMLKRDSFYIYNADYPIMPDISFRDYSLAIEVLKECGTY